MRIQLLTLVLAAAAASSTACASKGSTGTTTQAGASAQTQITAEDIKKANVATAYDAVDRLARRWFRDLSGNAAGDVAVYLSTDQLLGGREVLREIPAGEVVRMHYLKSSDAVARYGASASGGAIVVTRR